MFRFREEKEAGKLAEAEIQKREAEARQKLKAETKKHRQRIRVVCSSVVQDAKLDYTVLQDLFLKLKCVELNKLADELEMLAAAAGDSDRIEKIADKCREALENCICLEKEAEERRREELRIDAVSLYLYRLFFCSVYCCYYCSCCCCCYLI